MLKSNLAKFASTPLVELNTFLKRKVTSYPKLINLSVASTILITLFFIFIGLGYQGQWVNQNNVHVPMTIQTLRGISLFLIAWWCVCVVWMIKVASSLYKEMQLKRYLYFILGFFPYLNLLGSFYLMTSMSYYDYWKWFKELFQGDYLLSQHYNRKTWRYLLMCCVLLVMSPEIVFVWMPQYETDPNYVYGLNINNLWFYGFQYFTIQTNLFCIVFMICFVIYPHWKIFNNHTWLVWCIAYLMIVGVTYDAFLLPNNIRMHATDWTKYKWTKTMWEHAVNPLVFCISGLVLLFESKTIRPRTWFKTIRFGMIIPSVYLFYVFLAPFMTYQTVYSWLTNANPAVLNEPGSLLAHGEGYMVLLMVGYWFVFLALLTLIWYIDISAYYRYLRHTNKKQVENAR